MSKLSKLDKRRSQAEERLQRATAEHDKAWTECEKATRLWAEEYAKSPPGPGIKSRKVKVA